MEVRLGYQQTDIGVIPRDWDVKSLGDCASFRTGPFGSALHKSDYIDGGVPVVNPMHINDGRIEPTRAMSITETAAKALADFRLKAGEVVIGRRGDMGRCAVVQPEQDGWLCGTGSMIVRGRGIDEHFLQRVLSSPRAIASIEEASVGSTMVSLNQGTLARLKIQFPPITEQAAIAAALSDVDALLAGLDRLIAKKRDLKQAAMQQLLTGQTRLPGFQDEWVVKPLGELCSLKSGQAITAENIDDHSPYRCFGGNGLRGRTRTFTHEGAYALVGRQGALCGNVVGVEGKFFASEHALVVTARPSVSISWLTFVLGRMKLNQYSESSAQPGLSAAKLLLLDVRTPPSEAEQTAIAAALSDMDAELAALEARRKKTRALKQGMMQELLTGRIRLV